MFNQVETMEYAGHLSLSCNFILLRIIFYTTVRLSLFPVSLKFSRDKRLGKLSYNAQKFLVRICRIYVRSLRHNFMFMCFLFFLCYFCLCQLVSESNDLKLFLVMCYSPMLFCLLQVAK